MNKNKLTLSLTLTVLLITLCIQPFIRVEGRGLPFTDITSSYAKEDIVYLFDRNIMKGTSDTDFSPKRPITRAEFMTTLVRLLELEPVGSSYPAYTDVSRNAWYYAAVQTSTEVGLTEGGGGGYFYPNSSITRQEVAALIVRIMKQDQQTNFTLNKQYKDDTSISEWAKSAVTAISKLGLMAGYDGYFYPGQELTRQEAAAILSRLHQNETFASSLSRSTNLGIQIGWQYRQSNEQYKQSIMKSNVNVISPRWYFIDPNGGLSDNTVTSLTQWAHQNNKKVWPLFGNRSNKENTHQLLSSSQLSAAVIEQITNKVVDYGLDGINLDFENVDGADRAAFTSFVQKLATKLHKVGATLSVDVSPNFGTDWTEAFDFKALGTSADYIVMMGYDEHWTGGNNAGSVASLPWVQKGLDNLLKDVPSSKVILAMPFYTRDWTVGTNGKSTGSEDITIAEQQSRATNQSLRLNWDHQVGQYTTSYYKSANTHKIWLEDTRSLSLKYSMALKRNIAGFAYWHIGGETDNIWPSLRNAAKYNQIGR